MIEYEVQFARITTTGKIPDRFLNCQSKGTVDAAKAYMGTVYTLVEIVSPWFTTSAVGQSIINTFANTYYRGESTSDLDNFEEALKQVNENLAQITANGETGWIGKLNAVLAIQIDNKIHLAQTGAGEAYIFRDGKTNHLTYGLAQSNVDTHPLKTFSNITSGELIVHDKVLIANPELFKAIEMEKLCEVISVNTPREAVLEIAKILKKKKMKSVNVLLLELLTTDEASKLKATTLSDNVQLDKPIETVSLYWNKFWQSILQPALIFTGINLKKAGVATYHVAKKSTQKILKEIKDRQAAAPKHNDKFENEFLEPASVDNGLLKDEEIEYSPELNVHYYEQEQKKKNDKFGQFLSSVLVNLTNFATFAVSLWQNKKKRPYLLAGALIVVVLIIIFSVCSKGPSGQKLTLLQAQTILKDAQNSQKQANAAILASDNEKAKINFNDCLVGTNKIASIDVLKSQTKDLNQICQTELDKFTATTRFANLNPIVSGIQDLKMSFVIGSQVFFVNATEIYQSSLTGLQKPVKVATLPASNGDFVFGTLAGSEIYLYTSAQKVYGYNVDSKKLELSAISGNWEVANAGSFYAGTFYLLDSVAGQIYKHVSTNNAFEAGQNYLAIASTNLKNNISLAIDGSIYALNSAGGVNKLSRGQFVSGFALSDIPAPNTKIEKPVKLVTDADTTSIYILDNGSNKRILEFDKDGHFTHQYALPENLNNLTDFTVSIKAKKIWVLNAGSLYEIGI